MTGLERLVARWRGRRVALVGIGDPARGDDGVGPRLAAAVAARLGPGMDEAGWVRVIQAGTAPERVVPALAAEAFDHVVFLDALDFGGAPGEAALAGRRALAQQRPQLSTHRLSLGLLAQVLEARGRTRAWLLGVQPASLRPGAGLSPPVQAAVDALAAVLARGLGDVQPGAEAPP